MIDIDLRRAVIPLALFFGTFAWSFVYVSLPFYIERLRPGDTATTLRWTGWILGVTPLVTVVMAPVWGRLAASRDPKVFYVLVQSIQGCAFFGMALARTLPGLLAVRFLLGVVGASSTFAFIMAGRAGAADDVRRQIASMQGMMTVGQVLGPLAGAIAAARVGFRGSFVIGAGILCACAALVRWGAPSLPAPPPVARHDRRAPTRQVLAVCALVLGGSVQVLFLASILPQVLPDLGVGPGDTLLVGGVVIFASGLAAAAGSLLAPPLARALGERAAIVGMLVASSALLVCLAPLRSVWGFVALRFLQVLCVAPIFPIAVTGIVQQARGEAIGMVNGARIAAAFVGPVLSTSVLVWSSPGVLYVGLGALGLACVPLVRYGRVAGREALA